MTTPEPSIAETVWEIVDKQLKLSEHSHDLDPADDLWGLGMSSLNSVGLMLAIEDAFGIEFPEKLLNEATFRSVNTIVAAVERTQNDSQQSMA